MEAAPLLFQATGAVVVIYLIVVAWLARYLRKHHRKAWEEHGSFLLVGNNTPKAGWNFFRFMLSSKPRQLADRKLNWLVLIVWLLLLLGLGLMFWTPGDLRRPMTLFRLLSGLLFVIVLIAGIWARLDGSRRPLVQQDQTDDESGTQ